jgi:predicted N-acyltransferase
MEIRLHASADEIPQSDWAGLDNGGDPFASRLFSAPPNESAPAARRWPGRPGIIALREHGSIARPATALPAHIRLATFRATGTGPGPGGSAGLPTTPNWSAAFPTRHRPARACWYGKGADRQGMAPALIEAAWPWSAKIGASSWQCLFVEDEDSTLLAEAGLLMRRGVQFHWFNRGFAISTTSSPASPPPSARS